MRVSAQARRKSGRETRLAEAGRKGSKLVYTKVYTKGADQSEKGAEGNRGSQDA